MSCGVMRGAAEPRRTDLAEAGTNRSCAEHNPVIGLEPPRGCVGMLGRITSACAVALLSVGLVPLNIAEAATTAQVRIVDDYNHGKVRVAVDSTTHTVAYGHSTALFAITPSSSGNDGVSVTSLRFAGCGEGDVGNYFAPGHKYRVVVYHPKGQACILSDGSRVAGPGFRIVKVS